MRALGHLTTGKGYMFPVACPNEHDLGQCDIVNPQLLGIRMFRAWKLNYRTRTVLEIGVL
jgi:hypothetical protein